MGMTGLEQLSNEFKASQKQLIALGDENRQQLILKMIEMYDCGGIRVGALAESSHLSRPAVSQHLQILKDAGFIKMRREGTKNYYYFPKDAEALEQLVEMLLHAKRLMSEVPEIGDEEDTE